MGDGRQPELTQARLWLVEAARDRPRHRPRPARASARPSRCEAERARPLPALPPARHGGGRRRRAAARSAAATCSTWPSEYGTPLFVYDEAHLRARCREAVAAFGDGVATRPRRSSAWPWPAWRTRRACTSTWRPAASSTWPLAAGVPRRPARRCTATTSPIDELRRRAATPASAASSSTASTSSTASSALVEPTGGAARRCSCASRPGVEAHTHEYVMHRPGRLEVRLRARQRRGRGAPSSGPPARRAVELVGLHAHIGSQVFVARLLRAGGRGAGRRSSTRSACPSCRSAAASACAYVEGEEAPTITEWGDGVRAACAARGHHRAGHRRAGPGDRGRGRRHALPVGTIKDMPGIRTYVVGRRRHERQPASRPLRQRLRGVPARAPPAPTGRARSRVVGKHCESGDVLVRDAQVPADLAVGDVLATPVTGAYGHSMGVELQQGAAPGGGVRARRRGPGGRAPRDARRPAPPATSSVRSRSAVNGSPVTESAVLGCGNVGGAARRADRRRRPTPSPPAPACASRSRGSPCATSTKERPVELGRRRPHRPTPSRSSTTPTSTSSSRSSAASSRPATLILDRAQGRASRWSPPTRSSSPTTAPSCSKPPRAAGVDLLFEAAVAGGIPLIRPLRESLAGERIIRVMGIVNGTTNYILTRMTEAGRRPTATPWPRRRRWATPSATPPPTSRATTPAPRPRSSPAIAFGVRVVAGDVYHEGISGDHRRRHRLRRPARLRGQAARHRRAGPTTARSACGCTRRWSRSTHPLAAVRESLQRGVHRGRRGRRPHVLRPGRRRRAHARAPCSATSSTPPPTCAGHPRRAAWQLGDGDASGPSTSCRSQYYLEPRGRRPARRARRGRRRVRRPRRVDPVDGAGGPRRRGPPHLHHPHRARAPTCRRRCTASASSTSSTASARCCA